MKTLFALILPFLIAGLCLIITNVCRADELAEATYQAELAKQRYILKLFTPKEEEPESAEAIEAFKLAKHKERVERGEEPPTLEEFAAELEANNNQ